MPKKICCCKEQQTPGNRKHYIAIPCYEYDENVHSEVGVHNLYERVDQGEQLNDPAQKGPFKLYGINQLNTFTITPDYAREIRVMIRGAGGGAPPVSFGGNAAYSQHEFPTRNSLLYYTYKAYVGAGGTGPEPGNFDVHQTIPFFGGGPGYPLAGWGGGAGAVISGPAGTYETVLNFPSVITGAGGGAANGISQNRYGGHGGITQATDGDGNFGGCGASVNYGGTAGSIDATSGSLQKGGRGYGNWNGTLSPQSFYGAGGGSGKYGGGGGGDSSSGGGGSSTTTFNQNELNFYNLDLNYQFSGTDVGPGNRCNPFFTFYYDPGLGGQRTGRTINTQTFQSGFSGANAQVVEYHRTKWCPCFETQTDFSTDTTGPINYKTHICLTEEQYQNIIQNLPDAPPPQDLSGIRVSFELNGARYILVQLDPDTTDPTTDHYYCSLGCEDIFVENNLPTNVKWYIPSKNFSCFDKTFDWFAANFQTYDFSNVTSCCDCFLAKPICTAPFTSCLGTLSPGGQVTGCICPPIPPSPVAVCKDSMPGVESAYYSFDPESNWLYLVVPGICWTLFGPTNLINKFDCKQDSELLQYRVLTNNKGTATTTDPAAITALFCNEQTNQNYCKDTGGVDCEITLQRIHPYCDYYAKKCAITVSSETGICVNSLYGLLACPPCPSSEIVSNVVDTSVSFRCGDGTNINSCDVNCQDWPSSGQPCQEYENCIGSSPLNSNLPTPSSPTEQIFSFLKRGSGNIIKFVNELPQIFTNIFWPYVYDNETNSIETKGSGIASNLIGGPGSGPGGGGGGGGGGVDPEVQPCPCNDGVPTVGCLLSSGDINYVGLKARINRLECPPADYEANQLCLTCGDEIPIARCTIRQNWVDVVDETSSYLSTTCMSMTLKDINEETPNVLTITFPGCLFYDPETGDPLSEEDAKAKAKTLYSLTPDPDLGPLVTIGYNGTTEQKNVQKLTVCSLELLLVSCNSEDIANAINNCLGNLNGGIVADAGDPYSWMNYRLEPCPEIPPTAQPPETVQQIIKTGDILVDVDYQEYNPTNNSVTVYFSAVCVEGVETCVSIKTSPICAYEQTDCGIGTINSSKSANIVSAVNWSRGFRPVMQQYKQYPSTGDINVGVNCEGLFGAELCPDDGILEWSPQNPMCTGEETQRISCNVYGPRYISCFVPGECNENPCPQVENFCDIQNCQINTCGTPIPACVAELQCTLSATPPDIS